MFFSLFDTFRQSPFVKKEKGERERQNEARKKLHHLCDGTLLTFPDNRSDQVRLMATPPHGEMSFTTVGNALVDILQPKLFDPCNEEAGKLRMKRFMCLLECLFLSIAHLNK